MPIASFASQRSSSVASSSPVKSPNPSHAIRSQSDSVIETVTTLDSPTNSDSVSSQEKLGMMPISSFVSQFSSSVASPVKTQKPSLNRTESPEAIAGPEKLGMMPITSFTMQGIQLSHSESWSIPEQLLSRSPTQELDDILEDNLDRDASPSFDQPLTKNDVRSQSSPLANARVIYDVVVEETTSDISRAENGIDSGLMASSPAKLTELILNKDDKEEGPDTSPIISNSASSVYTEVTVSDHVSRIGSEVVLDDVVTGDDAASEYTEETVSEHLEDSDYSVESLDGEEDVEQGMEVELIEADTFDSDAEIRFRALTGSPPCTPVASFPNTPVGSASNTPVGPTSDTSVQPASNPSLESVSNPSALSASNTPTGSASNTPCGSSLKSPFGFASNTPIESASNTHNESPPNTPIISASNTPIISAPNTPVGSASSTPFESAPNTPVESAPNTPVESASNTPVESASNTPVESAPNTPAESAPNTTFASNASFGSASSSPAGSISSTPIGSISSTPIGSAPNTPIESAPNTSFASNTSFGSASSTPVGSASSTPVGSALSTPVGSASNTSFASSTPAGSASSTPAGSVSSTPAGSVSSTPAGSVSSTPVGSASSTPVGSASSTPVGSASSTPRKVLRIVVDNSSSEIPFDEPSLSQKKLPVQVTTGRNLIGATAPHKEVSLNDREEPPNEIFTEGYKSDAVAPPTADDVLYVADEFSENILQPETPDASSMTTVEEGVEREVTPLSLVNTESHSPSMSTKRELWWTSPSRDTEETVAGEFVVLSAPASQRDTSFYVQATSERKILLHSQYVRRTRCHAEMPVH